MISHAEGISFFKLEVARGGLFSSACLAGLMLASVANAQTPSASSPGGASVEEVVVTGSRVSRVGFTAPTPITAVSAEQLRASGPTNIGEALRLLPVLGASTTSRSGPGSIGGGGSFLNLRRLGNQRTLTLLDGKRFVPSASSGAVDTSLFPQALVQRVDIVTGGASAAYGSDAVAGVVNFILDRNYTGIKGDVSSGVSTYGDRVEYKATLSAGKSFADGRGHFIVSGEYFHDDGIYTELTREAQRRECLVIQTPGGPTARGFYCNVKTSNGNYAGLITAGPLRGTTFDNSSNPIPYDFGTFASGTTQVGGDGIHANINPLAVPVDRATLYTRASWNLTDDITATFEANYGAGEYEYNVGSYSQAIAGTALTINLDNAYLTPVMRQRMIDAKVTSFRLGRQSRDLPPTFIRHLNYTTRAVASLEGTTGPVKWSGYYQHGENRRALDGEYNLLLDNYQEAADAVFQPSTGQIVCRTKLTNPNSACVPINVLGEHLVSPRALAYVTGTNYTTGKSTEDNAAFELNAEPFNLPAGPVSLAGGMEYRKETVNTQGDPRSLLFSPYANANGLYRVGNYRSQKGEFTVKEGFLETVVPLAKDLPFVQSAELNAAVRRTVYSTSGGVTTWKLGLTYRPADIIRFRGTRSRDIRAPNLSELFEAGTSQRTVSFLDQGVTPPQSYSQVLNITRGNPDLGPEIADTLTFGTVISPPFIQNLDISIDAYDIEIQGAIASVSGSQSTLDCKNGDQAACARITRGPDGAVVSNLTIPVNLSRSKSTGVDAELAYRFDLERVQASLPGTVSLRFLGNYIKKNFTVAPGAIVINRVGETGQPKWLWNMSAAYRNGPLNISGSGRYTGSGWYDKTTLATDLPQRRIPGQVLLDGRVSYDFRNLGGDYSVFLSVSNIGNKFVPPFGAQGNYDTIGRYYRVGLNFKY